jgi:hypothetical protein
MARTVKFAGLVSPGDPQRGAHPDLLPGAVRLGDADVLRHLRRLFPPRWLVWPRRVRVRLNHQAVAAGPLRVTLGRPGRAADAARVGDTDLLALLLRCAWHQAALSVTEDG